jgi:hypothetical protein
MFVQFLLLVAGTVRGKVSKRSGVVEGTVVVETLLKLAGIKSGKEEDASSTVVKAGSVTVKVGVVSCVMS